MFCKKCENKIEGNALFCQMCGEKVIVANVAETAKQNLKTKTFLGNTFNIFNTKSAFIFGVLMILVGLQNVSYVIAGISIILGTFAYKSAKSRVANVAKSSVSKQILEIVLLGLIFVAFGLQNNIGQIAIEDPVPNILIPAGIITAYIIALFGNHFGQNKKKRFGIILGLFVVASFLIAVGFQLISA